MESTLPTLTPRPVSTCSSFTRGKLQPRVHCNRTLSQPSHASRSDPLAPARAASAEPRAVRVFDSSCSQWSCELRKRVSICHIAPGERSRGPDVDAMTSMLRPRPRSLTDRCGPGGERRRGGSRGLAGRVDDPRRGRGGRWAGKTATTLRTLTHTTQATHRNSRTSLRLSPAMPRHTHASCHAIVQHRAEGGSAADARRP